MQGKQWTANRRIYLDASGKVCEKGDPKAVTLLVAEGRTIPMKQAIELGLAQDGEAPNAAEPASKVMISQEDHDAAIDELQAKLDQFKGEALMTSETEPLTIGGVAFLQCSAIPENQAWMSSGAADNILGGVLRNADGTFTSYEDVQDYTKKAVDEAIAAKDAEIAKLKDDHAAALAKKDEQIDGMKAAIAKKDEQIKELKAKKAN